MIREIRPDELSQLLELYLYLHETSIPQDSEELHSIWSRILADSNYHVIVCEEDGRLVSSCVCLIIPNLTRGLRPYAFIENVVTHADYRGRGFATACLDYACALAKAENCYKVMLLTGSKQKSTLDFYRRAGFSSDIKTGFVKQL